MSVPAREVERTPALDPLHISARRTRPAPERAAPPEQTPAARPRTGLARSRRQAGRGLHATFIVFASFVIIMLVLGVVAVNAMFAQTAIAVHSMQTRVTELAVQHDVLATDVARLSSPSRIAAWAERYKMVLPEDVVILRVPRFGRPPSVSP